MAIFALPCRPLRELRNWLGQITKPSTLSQDCQFRFIWYQITRFLARFYHVFAPKNIYLAHWTSLNTAKIKIKLTTLLPHAKVVSHPELFRLKSIQTLRTKFCTIFIIIDTLMLINCVNISFIYKKVVNAMFFTRQVYLGGGE